MTLKRLLLSLLTLVVLILVGSSLVRSWSEPQISSRLQLYQTDLVLQAAELQPDRTDAETKEAAESESATEAPSTVKALIGEDPVGNALQEYQDVRQSAQTNLKKFQTQLEQDAASIAPPLPETAPPLPTATRTSSPKNLQRAIVQQQALLDELDLRIGVLQTQKSQTDAAQTTWADLQPSSTSAESAASDRLQENRLQETARVLQGLWSDPPRLLPDAEDQIQQDLNGWFRYTALTQLYQLQQRPDALKDLQIVEQQTAQQTLLKLALVGAVPVLGCLIGAALLVFLLVQRVTQGKQSILAHNGTVAWETPWDWETTWQVLIVGFFFVGQIALPFLLTQSGVSFAAFGTRSKAVFSLTYYLLMASSTLLVLYLSIKRLLPLPEGWFKISGRGNWFWWGLGGYFVALPLMIVVSIANQRIWQGQGGSNPLLEIVLEEGDRVSLSLFLLTAAVAAPIFEEILFRGFLLPSLTRYLPVWGAIVLSSLIFATAHLSLSEVLPLTVLGAVLGFVYTRSRNLLSSILLHSLWNSVTMVGLFLLGSGRH